jgi:hypothetical protein
VGWMPLESHEEEYRRCANSPHIEKTWFNLTTDVFVSLLFRVIILLIHYCHLISY